MVSHFRTAPSSIFFNNTVKDMKNGNWKSYCGHHQSVLISTVINFNFSRFTVNQPGCKIPEFPLWSTDAIQYNQFEPNLLCDNRTSEQPRPPLVRDDSNCLHFDHSALSYYSSADVNCTYVSLFRVDDPKDEVSYGDVVEILRLDGPHKMVDEEFIEVNCFDSTTMQPIYKDFFAFLPPKADVEKRSKNHVTKTESLSALIIGLDSLSRLQFHRHLPRSAAFLKENMNSIEMVGYNKVAENTYPNLVALLGGQSESQLDESCLIRDSRLADNCSLIWKHFHDQGYRSVFVEDAPELAIFNWGAKGFLQAPTDYYLRPLYLKYEHEKGYDNVGCGFRCLGSRSSLDFLLGYALKTAKIFNYKKYFGLLWSCSYTHNSFSFPRQVDESVLRLLNELHYDDLLNNTMLIVMSDHGPRLIEFKNTVQGSFEKRTPLLSFVLPSWFTTKYPEAMANLRANSLMLTTHFDLHHTLHDLTNLNSLERNALERRMTENPIQGQSLFIPISKDRNCKEAYIPVDFCACLGQGPM